MDDLFARIRSIMVTTPVRWTQLALALSGTALTARPAPKEWSAVECLQHMIDTERTYQRRLGAFLKGSDFPAFNPDTDGTQNNLASPAELTAEFAGLRQQTLEQIERLSAADLDRTARHPELGPVTLRQMLNTWAAHDLNHTIQAERALIQPYIRDCGPWDRFFTSQVIPTADQG